VESPAARLLTLLSLLQARPSWTATELSDRMAVTPRTVRRDISQLRELGYPVDAEPGPHGGYRLGSGAALPPLLLTDDEAVAVVVGLRVATGHNVTGFEEASVAALAKLEQVMPSHLRHRIDAVHTSTVPIGGRSGPPVDATTIVLVAQACRGLERLRFDYVDSEGDATDRLVEPFRLVHVDRRWYLVAHDPARGAWRTFRLDRMAAPRLTGARFVRTEEPDAAAMVTEGIALHAHEAQAVVELDVPVGEALEQVPVSIGVLEATATGCRLRIGGDIDWMARFLVNLPFPFRVIEPPELRVELRSLGERLQRDHR
jgi:predicted DNA-binding transcriptional regulator YafY